MPYVLLKTAKLPVFFSDAEAEAESFKEVAPFGQVPLLFDQEHQVVMAQSAGIAVYAARLAGLDGGADLRVYSQVLQYIELEAELSSFLGKAFYTGAAGSPERTAAWDEAKKKIDIKLQRVVANLGANPWLVSGASSASAADFALATALWLLSQPDLWPTLREEYPALAAHSDRLLYAYPAAAEVYAEMNAWEAYYKRS